MKIRITIWNFNEILYWWLQNLEFTGMVTMDFRDLEFRYLVVYQLGIQRITNSGIRGSKA